MSGTQTTALLALAEARAAAAAAAALGPPTWAVLVLSAGWTVIGGNTPRIALDGAGFVHLQGRVQGDGTGPLVALIPAGLEPAQDQLIGVFATDVGTTPLFANLQIATSGAMQTSAPTNAAILALDGVTWSIFI